MTKAPITPKQKNNLEKFNFLHKNLLGIEDLSSDDIEFLLDESLSMLDVVRSGGILDILHGRFAINLFFENSTRTLNSFDIAARRLGAQVINVSTHQSSIKKGETLLDTAATLNAMKPDIIIIRHKFAGVPELLANKISCPVINAGDGAHEHPTQALLDALTIRINKGKIKNMKIAICGDILHSRVAYSNIILLNKMQAELHLVAPPTLMPRYAERLNVTVHYRMEPALQDCDIIMMLRLQNERMDGVYLPSAREFYRIYGLDQKKLAKAKDDALVMHPGPTNRGVEIDSAIIDDNRSLIENQVENGVAVRMAVITCLMRNALKKKLLTK